MQSRRRRTNADEHENSGNESDEEVTQSIAAKGSTTAPSATPSKQPEQLQKSKQQISPPPPPLTTTTPTPLPLSKEADVPKDTGSVNVPRAGRFFLHDDRKRNGGVRKQPPSRPKKPIVEDDWKHDKFEEIVASEPIHQPSKNRSKQNNRAKNDSRPKLQKEKASNPTPQQQPTSKAVQPSENIDDVSPTSNNSNSNDVNKPRLNPSAREFQPPIYEQTPYTRYTEDSVVFGQPDSLHPMVVAGAGYGWYAHEPRNLYFPVPPPNPVILNDTDQKPKRKPIVSDKPIGIIVNKI